VMSQSVDDVLRRTDSTPQNLMEVRLAIEIQIAAMAAQRRQPEHLTQMRQANDRLGSVTTLDARVKADLAFHHALVLATGNPLFTFMLQAVEGPMRAARRKTLKYSGSETALHGHCEILRCVEAQDAVEAAEAMRKHLVQAQRELVESQT